MILYGFHGSPPVRAVRLLLAELGLDYEFKVLSMLAGDLNTPEYGKKNPQRTVPVLEEDDGTCINDSHAILAYLVRKYGKDDSLYPKDFYQRAVVDQRLHYESGVIFASVGRPTVRKLIFGTLTKEEYLESRKSFDGVLDMIETFLGDNEYVAGKNLTIADFSIVSTISTFELIAPNEVSKHTKVVAWLNRLRELPYFKEINEPGLEQLYAVIKKRLVEVMA